MIHIVLLFFCEFDNPIIIILLHAVPVWVRRVTVYVAASEALPHVWCEL